MILKSGQTVPRFAWILFTVLGLLMAASALYILVAGTDPAEFAASTGVGWEGFSVSNPSAARYVNRLTTLLGAGYLGFALFALAVTWKGFRQGQRWAWYALWIVPLTLGLTSATFFAYEAPGLGVYYGAGTVLALVGLSGTRARFLRP